MSTQLIVPCEFVRELRPFQFEALRRMDEFQGRCILADDQGLGKTTEAVAYISVRRLYPALIVVPATLRRNFVDECVACLPSRRCVVFEPATKSNKRCQTPSIVDEFDVVVVSYENLAKHHKSVAELARWKVLVADEAHKMKNKRSKRTKAIVGLVKNRRHRIEKVILMTGTPMLNRPVELFPLVNLLAPHVETFSSFDAFVWRYCNPVQKPFGMDYTGSANLAELSALLYEHCMIRRTKDQVLPELSAKRIDVLHVDIDTAAYNAERQKYEGVLDDDEDIESAILKLYKLEPDETVKTPSSVVSMEKYKRAAAPNPRTAKTADEAIEAVVAVMQLWRAAAMLKTDKAVEWIARKSATEKVVVFAHHQAVVEAMHAKLTEAGVATRCFYGGCTDAQKQEALDSFKNDETVRVIVLSIVAGNYGLTLTMSRTVVFMQLPWTPAEFMQAADRVHRIGQDRQVEIFVFVAKETMEETMWATLRRKSKLIRTVMHAGDADAGHDATWGLSHEPTLKTAKSVKRAANETLADAATTTSVSKRMKSARSNPYSDFKTISLL